jgi:plastocyanin
MAVSPIAYSKSDNQQSRQQDSRKDNRQDNKQDRVKDNRQDNRMDNKQDRKQERRQDSRQDSRYEVRNGRKMIVVAPRHRNFRNVIVIRPHGHVYWGYGHHHSDSDAFKWLAFTAITLKLLDNVNEQAQREHEAAQIQATSAGVGEKITWATNDANGYVVTTKQGMNGNGLNCREFQQNITVGGNTEEAYGTACLQADGAWSIVGG